MSPPGEAGPVPDHLVRQPAEGLEFLGSVILFEASDQFVKHWNITPPDIFLEGTQLIVLANEPRHLMESFPEDFNH